MKRGAALENLTGAIVEICRSGLAAEPLRDRVLSRLRRAVPFDAAFWTTVDPTTLLFTQPHQEAIPAETVPYFVHNEFLDEDVNKWTALARDRAGVGTLVEATGGALDASPRYRDIFRPLGLGDELRAVLRTGGVCWGYVCLHREQGVPFSSEEVLYIRRLAPHLADGIRAGLLVSSLRLADLDVAAVDAPGLIVVSDDGTLLSTTAAGDRWLAELRHRGSRRGLPVELQFLIARLRTATDAATGDTPRLRMRTASGRWAVLHASYLPTAGPRAIAVIVEAPSPGELTPLLMLAYGLTKQERVVTQLVCHGLATRELADRLHITPNTVQDHLKSIFDKTGASSRRELVSTILREQYLPRAMARQPIGPSGSFRA